ncbi:NfeD family protein [bacterium]|nr:NfeD family protein [bacterium]
MLEAWHIWLIGGFLLAMAEILVPGFFLLPFGVAGMATAAFSLLGLDTVWDIAFFVFVGGIFLFLTRKFFVKADKATSGEVAKTNIAALVGMVGMITQPTSHDQHGYVKVGGEEWRAIYSVIDDTVLDTGEKVKIIAVDGNKLIVERVAP